MRVFLCVNRGYALQILHGKESKSKITQSVYFQKKRALKTYPQGAREYIRNKLKKNTRREPVVLFLLDISEKYLTYLSGDRLDPYTNECEPYRMDTEFSLPIRRIKIENILSMETWIFFLDKNKRLKYKRAYTLFPEFIENSSN